MANPQPTGKRGRKPPPQSSAGWYPDPAGSDGERYWDGIAWSQATRDKVVFAPPVEAPAPGYGQSAAGYGRPMSGTAASNVASFGWRFLGFLIDFILAVLVGGFEVSAGEPACFQAFDAHASGVGERKLEGVLLLHGWLLR